MARNGKKATAPQKAMRLTADSECVLRRCQMTLAKNIGVAVTIKTETKPAVPLKTTVSQVA
jgi:hypothetical protein